MAQPTPYTRQYNFTDYQTLHPADPLPGTSADAEFNGIKVTLDGTLNNLAQIQRDDGRLRNGSVTSDSFSASALALIGSDWRPRGDWVASGTLYAVNDMVTTDAVTYVCLVAHAAAALFSTDLAAARWMRLSGVDDGSIDADKLVNGAVALQAIMDKLAGTVKAASLSNDSADLQAITTKLDGTGKAAFLSSVSADLQAITTKLMVLQSGTGAVARTVTDKLRETVSVKDFTGADPTGASDSLAAFQAAVNTGKNVYIPDGDWRLSGAVTITTTGQQIIGSGAKCRIQSTSATADFFTIGDGVSNIRNVAFRDFVMYATVTKVAGAAIRFRLSQWCSVTNVQVSSVYDFQANGVRLYDGIVFEATFGSRVDGCDMWGFGRDAIRVYGDATYNAELTISNNCWIAYAERYGVYSGGSFGGLHLESISISACWRDVCIDKLVTATANREIFITQASLDASSDANLWVGEGGASFIECTGMWVASAGRTAGVGPSSVNGVGVHVDPNNSGLILRITGGKFYNCAGAGLTMNSGKLFMTDVVVTDNGSGAGLSDHGVWFPAAVGNVGPAQIVDCYFESNTGYDLYVDDQLVYSRITNNVFRGSGTGTLNGTNAPSATNIVANNVGYRTRSDGTGTVLTGNTSVVVNHGLVNTPTNIHITPLAAHPDGDGFYVVTATSTTITVGITTAALADRAFYWTANYGVSV
jgi:hypothetical protein